MRREFVKVHHIEFRVIVGTKVEKLRRFTFRFHFLLRKSD